VSVHVQFTGPSVKGPVCGCGWWADGPEDQPVFWLFVRLPGGSVCRFECDPRTEFRVNLEAPLGADALAEWLRERAARTAPPRLVAAVYGEDQPADRPGRSRVLAVHIRTLPGTEESRGWGLTYDHNPRPRGRTPKPTLTDEQRERLKAAVKASLGRKSRPSTPQPVEVDGIIPLNCPADPGLMAQPGAYMKYIGERFLRPDPNAPQREYRVGPLNGSVDDAIRSRLQVALRAQGRCGTDGCDRSWTAFETLSDSCTNTPEGATVLTRTFRCECGARHRCTVEATKAVPPVREQEATGLTAIEAAVVKTLNESVEKAMRSAHARKPLPRDVVQRLSANLKAGACTVCGEPGAAALYDSEWTERAGSQGPLVAVVQVRCPCGAKRMASEVLVPSDAEQPRTEGGGAEPDQGGGEADTPIVREGSAG